jgi:hypothetical protein
MTARSSIDRVGRGALRGLGALALLTAFLYALAAPTVPNEIKQPGTQPGEAASFTSPDTCDNCHGGITQPVNPGLDKDREPAFGWRGGMMANAGRDPLFWSTLAIAEQDFVPNADPAQRGGAGDLCLRCHAVNGWISQRSTPTNGSGLSTTADTNGVECEFCHLLTDPDPLVNLAGTTEVYNAPFEPFDPSPSNEPYRGTGQYVINGNGTRLGPFTDANAKHPFLASPFHRKAELCGTCHDVSNPAVGDLAHNNGAQVPLAAGHFSGVFGSAIDGKAAFNNPPYKYGIVERTSSEWTGSAYDTLRVSDFATLPSDLKATGGAVYNAYHRAFDQTTNANRPNYQDGTVRYFTCQTCHMSASTGLGCNKQNTPTRPDLPRHDQTGSGYWMPDVLQYMDSHGTLRLGGGLTQTQRDALNDGKARAASMLQSAAALGASQQGAPLVVRVTNLSAHKLISGYPEGRRMWLNLKWYDAANALVREDGAYGPIGRNVQDNAGVSHAVQSLLDLDGTVVYEAKPGLDQQWAAQLTSLGYPSGYALDYDRMTDAVTETLGQLASSPAGTQHHTFHFVLNNVMTDDDRIPPYGFSYDEAHNRNTLPVPASQFGSPGPGGTFNYWDDRSFAIPATATHVEVRLYYQQTSWEYVHFLWRANDGADTFLANEGRNLLDAWLNTGMSTPLQLALATATVSAPTLTPGEADAMHASYNAATGAIDVTYAVPCDSANHRIVYGPLSGVASYAWSGMACNLGISGNASFDPGPGNAFFVIVANDATAEGSYGKDGAGVERPEANSGACDLPQHLANRCDVP